MLPLIVLLTIILNIVKIAQGWDSPVDAPRLLKNYIPVSLHVLHHCIEMIQYEPAISFTTATPGTTTDSVSQRPTIQHRPGYFRPEKPPMISSTSSSNLEVVATQPDELTKPSTEKVQTLLWTDNHFIGWFLRNKNRLSRMENGHKLQLLDPLPLRLLQDINAEHYELPSLLDKDNINAFRIFYDDKFPQSKNNAQGTDAANSYKPFSTDSNIGPDTIKNKGKKRVPPTKPYIQMLMLYDMLRREAKKFMFQIYEGYSSEIIQNLVRYNNGNGQQQLLFVLNNMLEAKNIEKEDVVSRTKLIITDLQNPDSSISKALIYIPPLIFEP
ncbi:uncharacterized protein LOC128743575 isoform X1 [Sabethes cyaneus]|uniref:uncharacterized protein LOC128743575 isoform X1 n=1 Tax=Sabethes cyaneus TaxID=53552 RepID=UPI00237DF251|nr:uncharacterized protein LOC128743575 isoform X1 [Sabethes cyaneus]XP_053696151.1 uncharacterized protein LOC128743575 isoform X1 [Sabethes cyaneus]XP_053696153.1 uncharacterized protein LOC128743575 isoform X1 [Sabethes cyaneus]